MMQWMSAGGLTRMDDVVIERAAVLREQMSGIAEQPCAVSCDDE